MVAAAGLARAVAAEEGPVLWAPVVEPQAVFRHDGLSEALESGVWPESIGVRFAGALRDVRQSKLPGNGAGDQCLATSGQLQAVVGQFPSCDILQFFEHVGQRQCTLAR